MPVVQQTLLQSQTRTPTPDRSTFGKPVRVTDLGHAGGAADLSLHPTPLVNALRLGHNLAHVAVDQTPAVFVQRYTDVKVAYDYPNRPQDEQSWLDDYAEIQAFLADRQRIKPHLQALADRMVQRDIDLSAALATFEAGTWAAARPTMIGFVSAAQFENVVAKGQIFEDLVASAHGVQTHRIQWFCIKREESLNQGWLNHTVISLFKDAVAPRWRQAGGIAHKNMWDFIVDTTGDTDAFDFTKPENLEAYVSEDWLPVWYFRRWNIGRLTKDVRAGHAEQPTTKQQYKDLWNNQASAEQKAQAVANNNARITAGGTIFAGFTVIGEPTIAYPTGTDPEASV